MNEMQNLIGPVVPTEGSQDAYLLGRYPHTMYGWFDSALWFERTNPPQPWNWEFPFTAFANSIDWWPGDLLNEADKALRSLALLRAVDPGVLVEMHRHWDELGEFARYVMRYLQHRRAVDMNDAFWGMSCELVILLELTPQLFVGQGEPLQDWHQVGDVLGKSLYLLALDDRRDTIPEVMTKFIDLGKKLLPENALNEVIRLYNPQTRYSRIPKMDEPAGKLISAILKLDEWIEGYLQKPVSPEPYLVFDDKNRTVTFRGTEISFDDFPSEATGGLNLLRVSAQHPRKSLSATQLIERSGLAIDANQVPAYLSRFRTAFKKLFDVKRGGELIGSARDLEGARMCFIIANRPARARAVSKDSYYELTLPPERVKYIAPT